MVNPGWSSVIFAALLLGTQLPFPAPAQSSKTGERDEWPALTEDERAFSLPGQHAVLLYRDEHVDARELSATSFYRIKVLTNEGRRYGNIEIPHAKGVVEAKDIQARVIQPDGSVIPFQGEVYNKTLARVKKLRIEVKALSLPGIQEGSIVEYRCRLQWKSEHGALAEWTLDHELYTRRARFCYRPSDRMANFPSVSLRCNTRGSLRRQPVLENGVYVMEVRDLPPFRSEGLMPPEQETRPGLQFYYVTSSVDHTDAVKADSNQRLDDIWATYAKALSDWAEKFLGKSREVQKALAACVAPADAAEVKLRKLYDFAQKIRNLTYERSQLAATPREEDLKENRDVEDVLRHGYGTDSEINLLYVALARAAGFESALVLTVERDRRFSVRGAHDDSALTGDLAWVRAGAQERFLDPGTPFCPYGLAPWEKTAVEGIRLVKGGGLWVVPPEPVIEETQVHRILKLRLAENGRMEGDLKISFSGQEALSRRLELRNEDDLGRREALSEQVEDYLPDGSSVDVLRSGPWDSADPALEAEFHVSIRGMVAATPRRLIVTLSVLRAGHAPVFRHSVRMHPVYIPYHYQEADEVWFQLPPGYHVESLPEPRRTETPFGRYETSHEAAGDGVRMQRREVIQQMIFQKEEYRSLRLFFEAMRVGDEDRMVLRAADKTP